MDLKIRDFGLATQIKDEKIRGVVGIISYCAPEVLKNEYYSFEGIVM